MPLVFIVIPFQLIAAPPVEIDAPSLLEDEHATLSSEIELRLAGANLRAEVERLLVSVNGAETLTVTVEARVGEDVLLLSVLSFERANPDWIRLAAFAIEGAARSYAPEPEPEPEPVQSLVAASPPAPDTVVASRRWLFTAAADVAAYPSASQVAPGIALSGRHPLDGGFSIGGRARFDLARLGDADLDFWESSLGLTLSYELWRRSRWAAELEGELGVALLSARRADPEFSDLRTLLNIGAGGRILGPFAGDTRFELGIRASVLPSRPIYELDGEPVAERGALQVAGYVGVLFPAF